MHSTEKLKSYKQQIILEVPCGRLPQCVRCIVRCVCTMYPNDASHDILLDGAQIISYDIKLNTSKISMRNVGVVASDHACDQKPRRKRRKEEEKKRKREKKKVIFKSMAHNSLWP